MPFQLFVGYCRRRKLLNSMRSTDAVLKEQGTKILENYRKQSDAFVKRVKQEWEESKSSKGGSGSRNDDRKFLEERIKIIESTLVPNPRELEYIIKKVKTLHPVRKDSTN
jgi:hypothetical protein